MTHWTADGVTSYITITISDESVRQSELTSLASSPDGIRKDSASTQSEITPFQSAAHSVIDGKLQKLRVSLYSLRLSNSNRSTHTSDTARKGDDHAIWDGFQFVAERLDIPVWLAGSDGHFLWTNAAWRTKMRGLQPVVHTDDVVRSERLQAKFLLLQKPFETLHRLDTVQGWRWYRSTWNPIFRPRISTQFMRWAGVCQDVHDQISAVESAELAQEQLMLVINKAGLYLYIYDRNLICQDFYGPGLKDVVRVHGIDGILRTCKRDYDEIADTIGLHVTELFGCKHTELLALMHEILNGTKLQAQLDIEVKGQYYRCKLAAIVNGSEVVSVVAFNTKVTELKLQEAEAQKLQVEAAVAQRSSIAKSQFLANTSHEIRTPIAGILGLCSMLYDTRLDAAQQILLSNIEQSADSLLAIINDILDISKIEAGKLLIESLSIDVKKVIESAVDIVAFSTLSKDITLTSDIDLPDRLVYGDPVRLRQVLLNLLSNAVKFSKQSSTVSVLAKVIEQNVQGVTIEIRIVDQGEGITPEQLENLFQPFSQADASTTRKHGGTGLGLVICSQLMKLMRGKISLTSEIGIGSEARIVMPLSFVTRNDLSQELSKRRNSGQTLKQLSELNKRILVAEDNVINRKIAVAALKKLGFTDVVVAKDGIQACELVEAGPNFDLIFMDCQMPERDGYEATKMIRKSSDVPIIAMTASAIQGDKEACLAVGMSDYLSKPVKPALLEKMLIQWLYL